MYPPEREVVGKLEGAVDLAGYYWCLERWVSERLEVLER